MKAWSWQIREDVLVMLSDSEGSATPLVQVEVSCRRTQEYGKRCRLGVVRRMPTRLMTDSRLHTMYDRGERKLMQLLELDLLEARTTRGVVGYGIPTLGR